MKLRKDDPVYYKSEIRKLIKEAKENGVEVYASIPYACYDSPIEVSFKGDSGEIASVYIRRD